jgi:hypothetical protein
MKEKHSTKDWRRKNHISYEFLKEVEFCAFNRFSQILEETNRVDPVQELFDANLVTKEEFLLKREYQSKLSNLIKICFDTDVVILNHLDLTKVIQQLEEYGVGEFLDPIEANPQKVDNKIKIVTKSESLRNDYNSIIESNQSVLLNSEEVIDKFLISMNIEEDNLHKMIRYYKTFMRKNLIRLIRIMTECILKKRGTVRIILCNEIEYIMFEFFAELLIKFLIYHKNEFLKIESCQFRNGKCYFIKLTPKMFYKSNRLLVLKEREIPAIIEMNLSGVEMFDTFDI